LDENTNGIIAINSIFCHTQNMSAPHLLIVDDDTEICSIVKSYLEERHMRVTTVHNGLNIQEHLKHHPISLIILDVMMPGPDGLSLCQDIRKKYDTPIIILSAAAAETDRIIGLEVGADDYLTKPFSLHELYARIKALLRRHNGHHPPDKTYTVTRYAFDHYIFLPHKRELIVNGQKILLSPSEADLLHMFVKHPLYTLSRAQLLNTLAIENLDTSDRSIDSHIKRLRKKLQSTPQTPPIIQSIRSKGYRFNNPVTKTITPLDAGD
jgi:two-component system, OmpR family, response regulator